MGIRKSDPLEWHTVRASLAAIKERADWNFTWIMSGPEGYVRLDIYKKTWMQAWYFAVNEDFADEQLMWGTGEFTLEQAQVQALRCIRSRWTNVLSRIDAAITAIEADDTEPSKEETL